MITLENMMLFVILQLLPIIVLSPITLLLITSLFPNLHPLGTKELLTLFD